MSLAPRRFLRVIFWSGESRRPWRRVPRDVVLRLIAQKMSHWLQIPPHPRVIGHPLDDEKFLRNGYGQATIHQLEKVPVGQPHQPEPLASLWRQVRREVLAAPPHPAQSYRNGLQPMRFRQAISQTLSEKLSCGIRRTVAGDSIDAVTQSWLRRGFCRQTTVLVILVSPTTWLELAKIIRWTPPNKAA